MSLCSLSSSVVVPEAGSAFSRCQCLLVAALALHGEAGAVGEPVHAREIDVGVRTEIDLQRWRAARGRIQPLYEQLHDGIAGACGRVTLLDDFDAVGVDLEAIDFGHRRFIDPGEGDALFIRRPPVAGAAIHLLLRDEFRGSIADDAASILGDRSLGRAREIVDDEVLVADEAHVRAVRREVRVGFVACRRS